MYMCSCYLCSCATHLKLENTHSKNYSFFYFDIFIFKIKQLCTWMSLGAFVVKVRVGGRVSPPSNFKFKKGRKTWKGRSLPFIKIAIINNYVFLTKIINLNAPRTSVTKMVSFTFKLFVRHTCSVIKKDRSFEQ